jgi:hypothetical protein
MEITSAYSFLVHPSKHEDEQPEIGGTEVELSGKLFSMLQGVFDRADEECKIDIVFCIGDSGEQENPLRTSILEVLNNPSLESSHELACKLQVVTTQRSGLGLFFIVLGKEREGNNKRIYLARFPADSGIVAEEKEASLHVDFIEQVFMKSAHSYKAVVYDGHSDVADFWAGKAIDKQVSNNSVAISGYWIREFLQSDFKTTPEIGTRRFAIALTEAIKGVEDLGVKQELTALATLAPNMKGKTVSIENFGDRFGLSDPAQKAMREKLSKPSLAFTEFRFSVKEFRKHIKYRQMQLSNGAMLSAPAGKFDACFEQKPANANSGEVQITTKGKVVDDYLRKTK